jgi:hypothetical protein
VAGYCECGDEPSGSCATELVSYVNMLVADYTLSTGSAHLKLWFSLFNPTHNEGRALKQVKFNPTQKRTLIRLRKHTYWHVLSTNHVKIDISILRQIYGV